MLDNVRNFNSLITEKTNLWACLKNAGKPVILYGMGDGALKVIKVLESYSIPVADIFANDEFVRGHSFYGVKVKKFREIEESYMDHEPVILVCFGTRLPEVIERIKLISDRYELYVPDVPVHGDDLFTYEYFEENKDEFESAYNMLTDEKSKQVFVDIINYKISGKLHYLLHSETDKKEVFKELIPLKDNESYLDAGAYDGDTVKEFLNHTKGYKRIIAVEPDRRNFRKLVKYVESAGLCNIELYNTGIWSEDSELEFIHQASRNSGIKMGGRNESNAKGMLRQTEKETGVQAVKTIDSLAAGRKMTYIKMDIEGAEFDALQGGRKTISEYRPKLNIAAYHRNSDLLVLPKQIKMLNSEYKIYLRHHKYIPAWDTNIYAI